jgi:mannose-6-phosphate isomerase-like protein (cupin superfamily)
MADPLVRRPDDLQTEEWDDPTRGRVRFATQFSGDLTPTDSMTSGVAEVSVGDTFASHRHAPAEIYHVLAGHGRVRLEGREVEVGPGSAVFIPSGRRHGIRNVGDEPLRLFYVLAVDSFAHVAYDFAGDDRHPDAPAAG